MLPVSPTVTKLVRIRPAVVSRTANRAGSLQPTNSLCWFHPKPAAVSGGMHEGEHMASMTMFEWEVLSPITAAIKSMTRGTKSAFL